MSEQERYSAVLQNNFLGLKVAISESPDEPDY